jgi:hypothetical protein
MRFYEFEAKKLLAKQGVRLPEGGTAATPAEARHLAAEINGPVWQADRSGPRGALSRQLHRATDASLLRPADRR